MKVIIKIGAVLIGVCMLAGTTLMFFKDIKIFFTRESAAYLSSISDVNHLLSVLFFVIYLCLTILIFKKISSLKVLMLLLVLFLWLLSGRVVAFKAFPDGRVITGWYYIGTDRFNLCKDGSDCESVISKESVVSKLPFWRINISNKQINKIIFVGPFTWYNCNKVFENHIGK